VGRTRKRVRGSLVAAAAAVALLLVAPLPAHAAEDTLELGGRECSLIEVPTQAPAFGAGRCPGVRPGALVETRLGFCTMNFLWKDRDGRRYIGTAGHCILERDDERKWRRGPVAKDGEGRAIGRFRYARLGGEKDFAVIRLYSGTDVNPSMCHFGGPTYTEGRRIGAPVSLQHYGQGLVFGDVLPARTFYANHMRDRDHVFATGTVLPGDSGGPVTLRGPDGAVGLAVTLGAHVDEDDLGLVGVTRLPPQVDRAEDVIDERLRLRTAPPS
jgi:hypothetical protein